ncbi:hypothetical protein ACN42_g521 [Penicillium freii]|uniref:Uncharacterized protein n=1 Tax=Penicillium freii TaxID=48697 RepID=A0A117NSE2_PENFR|nr:hypothetical protein ACN42_g521 [Penicillium freii]
MGLRHHPRFGGTPTLPERNLRGICGAQTIIKPIPLNDIFLKYSITVIYIPRLPQKRRASFGKPSLAAQQPQITLSLSASVTTFRFDRPGVAHKHPTICARRPFCDVLDLRSTTRD